MKECAGLKRNRWMRTMHTRSYEPSLAQRHAYILYASVLLLASAFIAYWSTRNAAYHGVDAEALWIGLACGVVAQLIDGALGMAYGISATSLLISQGITPVGATASVHIAEAFTTAASGISHWRLGNINSVLFRRLLLPGIVGALAGVLLVTSVDGKAIRPWISLYLLAMGLYVIYRVVQKMRSRQAVRVPKEVSANAVAPLAFTGAFADSVGGGGWGPIVTTTLVGAGHDTKTTIGSVNAAEFFITLASGFSFAMLIGIQHWEVFAGLIVGGLFTAPIAARLTHRLPERLLMLIVGFLILGLSVYNLLKVWG